MWFHPLKEQVRKPTQRFGDGNFRDLMDKLTHLLVLGFLVLATARHYDDDEATLVRTLQLYDSISNFFSDRLNHFTHILQKRKWSDHEANVLSMVLRSSIIETEYR